MQWAEVEESASIFGSFQTYDASVLLKKYKIKLPKLNQKCETVWWNYRLQKIVEQSA